MIVDATAVAVVILAVVGAVSAWMTVRNVRRRMRRWRAVLSWRRLPALPRQAAPALAARVAAVPATDPRWWLRQHQRQRMWRAVASTERAVRAARAADAPLGDLAFLTRQLHRTARSVDAMLRAGADNEARVHLAEVLDAAYDIRAAAVEAMLTVAQPQATGLADAVRTEVAAVRYGLTAADSSRR